MTSQIPKSRMEVVDYLLRLMYHNKMQPNDRLPSQHELCKRLGVNRNVVRAALARLQSQGRIYSIQGKGFFVAEKNKAVTFPHSVQLGFSELLINLTKDYSNCLLDWNCSPCTAFERNQMKLADGEMVYRLRSLRSVKNTPLAVSWSVLPAGVVPNLDQRLAGFQSVNKILMEQYGYTHPICNDVKISAAMPSAGDVQQLQMPDGIPILLMTSIFSVPEVGIVEYFITRARADLFHFYMDLQSQFACGNDMNE